MKHRCWRSEQKRHLSSTRAQSPGFKTFAINAHNRRWPNKPKTYHWATTENAVNVSFNNQAKDKQLNKKSARKEVNHHAWTEIKDVAWKSVRDEENGEIGAEGDIKSLGRRWWIYMGGGAQRAVAQLSSAALASSYAMKSVRWREVTGVLLVNKSQPSEKNLNPPPLQLTGIYLFKKTAHCLLFLPVKLFPLLDFLSPCRYVCLSLVSSNLRSEAQNFP